MKNPNELKQLSYTDKFAYYNHLQPQDFGSYQEYLDAFETILCTKCLMPESACICSQYDNEGNEL